MTFDLIVPRHAQTEIEALAGAINELEAERSDRMTRPSMFQ